MSTNGESKWHGVDESLGFLGGAATLSVSMIGTGVVSFPYAFALCGYIAGPVGLVAIGILAYLSYTSLIRCTAKLRVSSYGDLLQCVPGWWSHYTNISLWMLLILALTAYVLISANIVRAVFLGGSENAPALLRNPSLFAVILAVIFPLCLPRSLSGISWLSTYCSGAILVVVALIIWEACAILKAGAPSKEKQVVASTNVFSLVLALPILGCAMFGHMNISQIYAELRPDVKPNAARMVAVACVGTIALYAIVGAAGYAAFGSGALSDVVAQIAKHEGEGGVVAVIQGLLGSFIVLKMPLLIMPLRSITLSMWQSTRHEEQSSATPLSALHNAVLTFVLLVCVYFVALVFPDLGTLLEILGAVVVIPLCFIVPARLSWAAEKPRPVALCLAMGLSGIGISGLSLVAVAMTMSAGETS